MPDPAYSEDERRHFFRCITPIFRMERELGGTMFDAIILRAAAIGRREERPMSVSVPRGLCQSAAPDGQSPCSPARQGRHADDATRG